jgi:hypothetical protein
MPVAATSAPATLGKQTRQRPNALAYTFADYEVRLLGFADSLTWSEPTNQEITSRHVTLISIPITTTGKVRRSGRAKRYRRDEFSRLDIT